MAEQMSCTKPGKVSSAERLPPPIVSRASTTSTERPARASVIAAARPFGPAPTTIASRGPLPTSVIAAVAAATDWTAAASPPSADPADRGGHRPPRGAERRAVADVAPVTPLPVAVDARHLDLDDRCGHADADREFADGRLPEPVVLAVPTKLVGDLVERIRRSFERFR